MLIAATGEKIGRLLLSPFFLGSSSLKTREIEVLEVWLLDGIRFRRGPSPFTERPDVSVLGIFRVFGILRVPENKQLIAKDGCVAAVDEYVLPPTSKDSFIPNPLGVQDGSISLADELSRRRVRLEAARVREEAAEVTAAARRIQARSRKLIKLSISEGWSKLDSSFAYSRPESAGERRDRELHELN